VKPEADCSRPIEAEKASLQIANLPFSEAPSQTKLFLEYQKNPLALRKYYPSAVENYAQLSRFIPEILKNYKTDRSELCDVLEDTNNANGAGAETFKNIELLRESDCVAVVSGQQAGLFTGALYTIYKALSAVKLAECLRARGAKAVPVFWIATEDHDFAEISQTEIVRSTGELIKLKNKPRDYRENSSVGFVELDDTIERTITELFDNLPHTEFSTEAKKIVESSYSSGTNFGDAFARLLLRLASKYGLILLNPLDARLKKLAAPIYVEAIEKSGEFVSALLKRGDELESDGFHSQVLITPDYFPLFWQAKDGTRNAIKKTDDERYKIKNVEREFTRGELARIAASEPQRFSPSVVLRAAVQDYLLPTVCYFGGAAEVAYFAQSAEVYRVLQRPATTVLHRQSFTIVERKHHKTLVKYDLRLEDLLSGGEKVLPRVVEKYLNNELARLFDEVEEKIGAQLDVLSGGLDEFDPTLAANLIKRRRKIIYQIESLRGKFHRAQARKDETIARQIETAINALAPHKNLQERSVNILSFVNAYGLNFIDWIYAAIELDDKEHRIIYL